MFAAAVLGIILNSIELSKFFGPSPRKHRLTVYRGFQVLSGLRGFRMFVGAEACCTRYPGGNLVDGLPPVASTHAGDLASRIAFVSRLLAIPLYNRDARSKSPMELYLMSVVSFCEEL